MQIMVYKPADAINLIFFRLMFYFDEFQPGITRYRTGKGKAYILPARFFGEEKKVKLLNSAAKRNASNTAAVIRMMHILDEDNDEGIIIEFPLMYSKPMVCIGNVENSVSLTGDESCKELREGAAGNERPEEKEAFDFLLWKINEVIAECSGNKK